MKYRYILHTSRDKRLVALCHHQSNKVQRAERGPICLASRIKCHISYTTDTFKIGFPSDKNKRIKFLCVCIQFYQPKKEGGGGRQEEKKQLPKHYEKQYIGHAFNVRLRRGTEISLSYETRSCDESVNMVGRWTACGKCLLG